jgi:ABC-type sugar transport system permease subunit
MRGRAERQGPDIATLIRATLSRDAIDPMPTIMLGVVAVASVVVVCHLAVVLWLSLTSGRPGDPALAYTAQNFVDVFSDRRTLRVLMDTLGFALISLAVALGFGIPAAWLAERTDFRAKTLLFTLMAVGLLIPGFAAAMGWLFLMHARTDEHRAVGVEAFRVLTHDDEVDGRPAARGKVAPASRRPNIGEQIEALAQFARRVETPL